MTLYRALVWGVKGFKDYTNSGFVKASKYFDDRDLMVNLSNQSIMITGSNSGVGKAAALELAKRGATVYMVCRNKQKAEEAQRELIYLSGNTRIFVFIVDLSEPWQVHSFAKKFLALNLPLDILVNNAGCMVLLREFNKDGLEINFATNTLSMYILTRSFIPLLLKSQRPRVITVSSGGMLLQKLNPLNWNSEHSEKFDGQIVYAQNKRQQVVITEILARQYPMIYFATMHPGWSDTPAVKTSMPKFREMLQNKLRTPEQGADTIVWLCCYPYLVQTHENGLFYEDRKPVSKHLPLAHTKSTNEEEIQFLNHLEQLYQYFKT